MTGQAMTRPGFALGSVDGGMGVAAADHPTETPPHANSVWPVM
jgi:hypothetical protein